MSEVVDANTFVQNIAALKAQRSLVAIAGAPASGKSTLAAFVVATLNARQPGSAAVLEARGHRARKGAPYTFDVAGFRKMLLRLRDTPSEDIAVPVFDRNLEIARAAAAIISHQVRFVIVVRATTFYWIKRPGLI